MIANERTRRSDGKNRQSDGWNYRNDGKNISSIKAALQ